ncbi:MAG: site-specific integrase [Deltaproteobacteria bacterium]|nr:site-specific integrase [Deltaproteobacteria bacterium]
MTALRARMDNDMILRGMAPRTREAYIAAVARLARCSGRSPEHLSEQEVQTYLLHMIREEKLAWSTCNIAVHALRFLYHITLGRERTQFCIPVAKQPATLPAILSPEEVRRVSEGASNRKHRALLVTTYAAGLRVSEVVRLKVGDIDAARRSLRVEQGKGAKDRYTLCSPRLVEELRVYWRVYRPPLWLFPARGGQQPMDPSSAQKIYYAAKGRAGITKPGGIHALRHAFATHLLEAGTDLHTIQRLLGHGHIGSTMRSLHLAQKTLLAPTSPLELLDLPTSAPQA